jgi:imidazolonepropionase-like amidohydrolase
MGARRVALAITVGVACIYRVLAQDATETPKRPSIAIERVAVVDVVRGEVVSPRNVLVVDGRIAAIGEPGAVTIPPDAARVDGRGRYLMPGLVDMHVHLFNNSSHRPPNEWAFPLFVANGVTGLREMRTNAWEMPVVEVWRFKAARGEIVAPRVLAAGAAVGGSVNVSREMVRDAKKLHADFIKIFSELREPAWRAVVDEARAVGLPVCGHIPAEVSLVGAAIAGQRSNEHLTQAYEACSSTENEWLAARRKMKDSEFEKLRNAQEHEVLESFEQAACDRAATALAETKQVQVPTLVLSYFESRGVPKNTGENPRWRFLRADEQARWERAFKEGYPSAGDKLAAKRWEVSRQIVKTLHRAGVRILAGTDTPMPQVYPGFSLHKELELLVEAGLSPADALRAATIGPAEFLGLGNTTGSIAVGKRADLLLLDGDPLSDISQTQKISAVVLDGRLLRRPDLDRLLETASRK